MKSINIFRISSKYNIRDMFAFIPIDKTLKIILYSKKFHELLKLDKNKIIQLLQWMKVLNPTYQNIKKYIKSDENKDIKLSQNLSVEQELFFKAINSKNNNILIDLKDKNWKFLYKNLNNIKLEINPNLIDYINNMSEGVQKETLEYLKAYKKNIKEIYFNSFVKKEEINFVMRNKIKYILNYIFRANNKKIINSNYLNIISFGNNSIMSVFDINDILTEFCTILLYNNKIDNLYLNINSKTAKNDIINIKNFVSTNIPKLEYIKLDNFSFFNNSNSSLLSNLIPKLSYLKKIDLSGSVCDNNNLDEIFNNNNKIELKELKVKILYGEKKMNWKFLNKFEKFLENLEIEMVFPYNESGMLSYQLLFDYRYINAKELFSIINRMENLKKLKLIGDYLNNYNLNFLENEKITNLAYSFYIINPEKSLNYQFEKSLNNRFLSFNNLKEISLRYNHFHSEFMLSDKYNGIDLLDEYSKEKAYKSAIFEFPQKLSVLKLSNFTDKNFLKYYLIPLLNKNKEKLSQIVEIRLIRCFLEVSQFEEFLSMLNKMENLYILSINKIIFYDKFKMKNLINYIPTIFKNSPNLIELDLSKNKYKEGLLYENIIKIKEIIPHNLINLKIFNSLIPISRTTLKNMKKDFDKTINYEDATYVKNDIYCY